MDAASYFALGFIAGMAVILLIAWICAVLEDHEYDSPIDLWRKETKMNMPKNPERLIQELEPAVGTLAQMPVEMWHLWVIWVLEKMSEHAEEEENEEFLERVRVSVGYKVDRGSW